MLYNKKISVIIPCYNCEDTIDYCVNSIFAQTIGINNLEIILVNDASTDNTLSYLYEYEKLYPDTVIIINCIENGRQGTARNIALSYATGEYIAYVDTDDVIERNMYELMYQAACQTNAEIVVSKSQRISELPCLDTIKNNKLLIKEILEIHTDEDRKSIIFGKDINVAVWDKLYNRQFLIDYNIHFAEHIIYEDILFTMLWKAHISKLCILDNMFYYHIVNDYSCTMSESLNEQRIFHYLAVYAEVIEEYKKLDKYNQYRNLLFNWYVDAYLNCAYYHITSTHGLNANYLEIMDDSIEQLFPGMVNRSKLHKSIKELLVANIIEKKDG